ncbi:LPS translocon maturation chaperone LptM [Dyella sp.]|jgi:predicted small lipoprotein YifL|uniref:LPS translocon maturation chaperone LptM n=1 Tax=Dyella sp. TaxID=1869338 RepID=UPI002D78C015|nr:lipoprotein [Dyella sp.]HET6433981.1 lipoprotein [Dyella sp.]
MRRAPVAALLVLTVVSLAGCGNKGPLVLPSKATPAATPPATAPAAASTVTPPPSQP